MVLFRKSGSNPYIITKKKSVLERRTQTISGMSKLYQKQVYSDPNCFHLIAFLSVDNNKKLSNK